MNNRLAVCVLERDSSPHRFAIRTGPIDLHEHSRVESGGCVGAGRSSTEGGLQGRALETSGASRWEAGTAPSDAGREHRRPGTGQFWESHWAARHRQDQSLERSGDHGALARLPGGVGGL